jgi:hypothetical protein
MEKLFKLIKSLIDTRFYGTIEIHLELGKITYIRKTETIKID